MFSPSVVEVGSDNRVALAGGGFQPGAVQYFHNTMLVTDESGLLQVPRNDGYGWSLHAEHDGEEFMAEVEILLMHPVVRHQKPPGAALLDMVERITRR